MASKRGRRPIRARLPDPDYIVDLTVDSPTVERRQPLQRPSVIRVPRMAEVSPDETIYVSDLEGEADSWTVDVPLPPRPKIAKRMRKTKSPEVETIEESVVPVNRDSTTRQSMDLSCPVCLEALFSSARRPTSTRCGHVYCAECIAKTLQTSKKCPKCQMNITLKSCHRIYL